MACQYILLEDKVPLSNKPSSLPLMGVALPLLLVKEGCGDVLVFKCLFVKNGESSDLSSKSFFCVTSETQQRFQCKLSTQQSLLESQADII